MSDAPVTGGDMHAALKQALAELLPDMLRDHASQPVAQVPAPPVAQTLRPSTWHPAQQAPDPAQAAQAKFHADRAEAAQGGAEHVRLADDRDLDAFVRTLARRFESPAEREAAIAGRTRFTLHAGGQTAPAAAPRAAHGGGGPSRVERGAVTERIVEQAAQSGGVLVLGPKAVLTPMGRDRARALGVRIEREAAC